MKFASMNRRDEICCLYIIRHYNELMDEYVKLKNYDDFIKRRVEAITKNSLAISKFSSS